MKTIKKICKLLNTPCEDLKIKDVDAVLVDGKVFFQHTIFDTPEGRDMLHRAYLTYIGIGNDSYYKAMYKELEAIK